MSDVGDAAMALLGSELPGFQEALEAWRADCRQWGNEITWRDAISFLRGWRARPVTMDTPPPETKE